MNSTAIMFPILPDRRAQLFQFAKALSSERATEYAAAQQSVVSETWYLQSTPMGEFLIVHFEAPDPAAVFKNMAESSEPFDVWFRRQASEITGIDLSSPIGELPRRLFEYQKAPAATE